MPCEGVAIWRAKAVSSFVSYFKTLSIRPNPGIEPATPRSAAKRSTDRANPAAVSRNRLSGSRRTVFSFFRFGLVFDLAVAAFVIMFHFHRAEKKRVDLIIDSNANVARKSKLEHGAAL